MGKKRVSNQSHWDKKDLQNKPFWGLLAVLLLLTTVTLINFNDSGFLTGQATVEPISFMKAGAKLFFETRDITGVQYVEVVLKEDVKNGRINLQEDPSINFKETAYSKFTINSAEASKFKSTEFTLKIAKDQLTFPIAELRLYRNGKDYTPTPSKTDDNYYYFKVMVDGFQEGQYVIGRRILAAPEPEPKTETIAGAAIETVEPVPPKAETITEPVLPPEQEQPAPVNKLSFWQKIKNFFIGFLG